ncbi:MAG: trypsin-like peptidase domain-containing protein [Actinomycetota bacterium]|nr:trypsin-like peptidase domain-containing protein [Actinomycetota bacterium]
MKTLLVRTLCLALVAVLSTACELQLQPRSEAGGPESVEIAEAPTPEPLPSLDFDQSEQGPPRSSVADTIQKVLPSVVNVRVRSVRTGVFGEEEGKGEGSGVVIDRRGVIVTNNHVIAGATEVKIVLSDGRQLIGTVSGAVPERDLAVVRVDADDLTPIELGDSDRLRLGDEVIAIGFPLGLGPTVTKGIVSAQNRRIDVNSGGAAQQLSGLIQTDAAINPGNSGGALVDLNGRLVGINTAAAGAGFAENVGFAININSALPVIEEILTKPPSKRAWLGVFLNSVDSPDGQLLGVDPELEGALIIQVVSGSPADAAGLEAGDVVTALDGAPIADHNELIDTLTEFDPGDEVELEITNEEGVSTVTVELARRPQTFQAPED